MHICFTLKQNLDISQQVYKMLSWAFLLKTLDLQATQSSQNITENVPLPKVAKLVFWLLGILSYTSWQFQEMQFNPDYLNSDGTWK